METETMGKKSVDVDVDEDVGVVKERRKIRFDNTLSLGAVMLKGSGLRAGESVTVATRKGSGVILIQRVQMRRVNGVQRRRVEEVKD